MKYIHLVQFHIMSGGGVGSVITDLCEAMVKQGCEVHVVSLFKWHNVDFERSKQWAKEKGVNVTLLQKGNEDAIAVLCKLRKLLKQLTANDDVCLFMHLKWGVLAGIIGSFGINRVRRVEVYHSGYMKYKLQAFVSRPFIRKYISVSKNAKTQLMKWFHIPEKKIEVVYNGVDVDYIRAKTSSINPSDNGKLNFISVGRLSFEKGFLDSIKAYVRCYEEGKLKATSYTMVGDGIQMEEAKSISRENVIFTGCVPRDKVYDYIALSDVVILPSLWEGNSILMLEVLSIGRAMVLTDIPAFREVMNFEPLTDDESCRLEPFGVVFRNNNVDSCASALELMCANQEKLKEMQQYTKLFAENFSTNKQAENYLRIANELK